MERDNFPLFYKINNLWNKFFFYFENMRGKVVGNKYFSILFFLIVFLIIGLSILILNTNTPLVLDDFAYSFNSEGSLINGLSDIFKSQYIHYFGWGGRSVVHIIAQFLLFIDPLYADILNTLVYLLYCYLVYLHIKGHSKHSLFTLIFVFSLIFFLQPAFGETCLWLTGSANYTWSTLIILLFLLPYRLYRGSVKKNNYLMSFLMLLFGIIAGWTNENTAVAQIVLILLFLFIFRINKFKIPLWAITGLIGCLIGYVIMIIAPGNGVRIETLGLDASLNILNLIKNFIFSTIQFIQSLGIFNLFGFIMLLLFSTYSTNKDFQIRTLSLSLIYLIATLVCLYVMIFSPIFPPRSWFGIVTFNIIAVGIIIHNLDYPNILIKQLRLGVLLFFFFFYCATYYEAYSDVIHMRNIWKEREKIIEEKGQTEKEILFKIEKNKTRFSVEDTEHLDFHVSRYYHVNVKFED